MNASHVRGYAVALGLLGFSGAWAATAHDPFPDAAPKPESTVAATDPRVVALERREAAFRARSAAVRKLIAERRADAARPAPVRVVTVAAPAAAPVTQSRSS